MITMKKTKLIFSLVAFSFLTMTPFAHAEEIDLPTVTQSNSADEKSIEETHPAVELTMDKSELINIEEEIGSIIIGSPVHINVLADSSHTLVVVPRKPGASYFSVLDKKGKIIMQRHVIVAAPKEGYLRVKRTCTEKNCEKTSVYYCPDMCHEIVPTKEDKAESPSP